MFQWNNNNHLEGFQKIEKEYLKLKYDDLKINNTDIFNEIRKVGFQNHRKNVLKFIKSFPPIQNEQTIDSWVNMVNDNHNFNLRLNKVKNVQIWNTQYNAKEITFELLFNDIYKSSDFNYHVGTVHSVKGDSFEATLLILKNQTEFNESYNDIINDMVYENVSLSENPELRVVYVALSRPKKLLYLSVPKNDYGMWNSLFSYD